MGILTKDTILVLDIGNVVLPIDYNRTVYSFSSYTSVQIDAILSLHRQTIIFDQFERGEIDSSFFRKEVCDLFGIISLSDDIFDRCWNDLLMPVPIENVHYINLLRKHYRIVALSNINEIHARALDYYSKENLQMRSFRELFDQVYYSYELGSRKPESEIYERLQELEGREGSSYFFIDDKTENVDAAKRLGWNAEQLISPEHLINVLQQTTGVIL